MGTLYSIATYTEDNYRKIYDFADSNEKIVNIFKQRYTKDQFPKPVVDIFDFKKTFNICKTDIKVMYKGKQIESYSTGDKILVSFQDFFAETIENQNKEDYRYAVQRKNVEVILADYLTHIEVNKPGVGYTQKQVDNDSKRFHEITDPSSVSSPGKYMLLGDVFREHGENPYSVVYSQFANGHKNGFFSYLYDYAFNGEYERSYDFEAGTYQNGMVNGSFNSFSMYLTYIFRTVEDSDERTETIYTSGEYEDGKLKQGVRIDVESTASQFYIFLYEVNNFESALYYKSNLGLLDHQYYFILY